MSDDEMGLIIKFIILFIIIAFLDLIIFTYLHELSHKKALRKAGIKGMIKWNFRENIKHIKARPLATCFFDEKKLKNISYEKKKDIFLSGIKMDLKILIILSVSSIISWFLLVLNTKAILLYCVLIATDILILLLIWNILNNVFKKNSDLDKFLVHYNK